MGKIEKTPWGVFMKLCSKHKVNLDVIYAIEPIGSETFLRELTDVGSKGVLSRGMGKAYSIDGLYFMNDYGREKLPVFGRFEIGMTSNFTCCEGISLAKGIFAKGSDGCYVSGMGNEDLSLEGWKVGDYVESLFQPDEKE